MAKKKIQARHRRACRPVTPLTDLTNSFSPVRGVAATSVTGIALTVLSGGVATAAPESTIDLTPKSLATATESVANATPVALNPTITAPSDLEWTATDEVAVVAEPPAPEPVVTDVANRGGTADRSGARSDVSVQQAVPLNAAAGSAVAIASQYIGVPYVWGGMSPAGFDCSGLVGYVYAQLGYSLPRTAAGIGAYGTSIPASSAQPGDIVYYPHGHVGIYAGNGQMIHAPRPGRTVELAPIYGSNYYFVRL